MNSLEHSLHLGRRERRERGGREKRNERKGERQSRIGKREIWMEERAKNRELVTSFNVDLCCITSLSKYFIG